MRSWLVGLALLLFLGGCVSWDYEAKQVFDSKGNSVLYINDTFVSELEEPEELTSVDDYVDLVEWDYYNNYLPKVRCKNPNGNTCEIEMHLQPGEYYEWHDGGIDWLNLEKKSYVLIKKLPMLVYEEGVPTLLEYFQQNKEKFLPDDELCEELTFSFDLTCEKPYVVVFEDSVNLTGYACLEDEKWTRDQVVPLNLTLKKGETYSIPCETPYALLLYKNNNWFSDTENDVVFQRLSVDEVEKEIEENLKESYGYIKEFAWNFEKGRILGMSYDAFQSLASSGDISINYNPIFPAEVVSAKIGGRYLKAFDNEVELGSSLSRLPAGPIEVELREQLSPLGMWTWAVLAFIVLALIAWFKTSKA